MVSPWVLRDTSCKWSLPISCANLVFCSLPGRNQQFDKMVALVSAGETSQRYILTIHFDLGNIYATPPNSLSQVGMPVKREADGNAVQFDGSPKASLTKSSPCPPV